MSFVRYFVVSGLCALLNNASVIGLVDHGFGSVTATVIAFGPVLLVAYALHALFTFGKRPTQVSFSRFALSMTMNFPLWIAGLYLFNDILRFPISIAAPATTVLIFVWNFASTKWAFLAGSSRASRVTV
ncbi:MAG: GtrA family protein [Steroidobacteraceae bacterium]